MSKSRTTTNGETLGAAWERRLPTDRPPTHPGEMLVEEFLEPLGVSQSEFARRLGVSFPRLNGIINRRRSVTTDTALRLARVTGMSASFWLGLQQDWDIWHALRSEDSRTIATLEPLNLSSQVISTTKYLQPLKRANVAACRRRFWPPNCTPRRRGVTQFRGPGSASG